ncbi:MAG: putative lipase [Candidatus Deianiraeaceae bacterium]|jgi:predicted lipase
MSSIFENDDDKKDIIIAIRGTINKYETAKDFNAIYTKFKNYNGKFKVKYGFAEAGFYTMYKKIRPNIIEYVKQCDGCNITIAGHSLGFAIAALAGYDAMMMADDMNMNNVINIYAYAPPKIGDNILMNNFNKVLKSNTKGHAMFIINKSGHC